MILRTLMIVAVLVGLGTTALAVALDHAVVAGVAGCLSADLFVTLLHGWKKVVI